METTVVKGNTNKLKVSICNYLGQVLSIQVTADVIDLSNLSKGTYFIKLSDGNDVTFKTIIKQ